MFFPHYRENMLFRKKSETIEEDQKINLETPIMSPLRQGIINW